VLYETTCANRTTRSLACEVYLLADPKLRSMSTMDLYKARRLNKAADFVKDPWFLLKRGVVEEISAYGILIL